MFQLGCFVYLHGSCTTSQVVRGDCVLVLLRSSQLTLLDSGLWQKRYRSRRVIPCKDTVNMEGLSKQDPRGTWQSRQRKSDASLLEAESAFPTQNPINRITTLTEHYNRELHHREMSHCHCSYCSRQWNSSFKHPCEGASGQHNSIPSPSADDCSWLYPQHILMMQSALWEILRRCSPVVLQTVSIDAALFFFLPWHMCTHI